MLLAGRPFAEGYRKNGCSNSDSLSRGPFQTAFAQLVKATESGLLVLSGLEHPFLPLLGLVRCLAGVRGDGTPPLKSHPQKTLCEET